MTKDVILHVKDLTVDYGGSHGLLKRRAQRVRVLENFNLEILKGETLSLVGESGCGKTTLANSVTGFKQPASGEVLFEGRDIFKMDRAEFRRTRCEMQMVFQNPFKSLNPKMKVLDLVSEPIITHTKMTAEQVKNRVVELLEETGLDAGFLNSYPHNLSGGQAQRVALARAIALNPKLLILDEPTSALDVSVQAQIVNLLQKLQKKFNLTYMFISHGLEVVKHISNRVAVLYCGEVVELASRDDIFRSPKHPYTQALFSSALVTDPENDQKRIMLEGSVPSPINPPAGCRFHPRCPHMMEVCMTEKPANHLTENGHWATCNLFDGIQ